MELRIRAPNLELAEEVRQAIERRVRLALGRHSQRIAAVRITLFEGDPARAGSGAACRIRVRSREGPRFEIAEEGADLAAAAARASWRLEHRLDRERSLRPAGPRVA